MLQKRTDAYAYASMQKQQQASLTAQPALLSCTKGDKRRQRGKYAARYKFAAPLQRSMLPDTAIQ